MSSEDESDVRAIINCSQVLTLAGPSRPRVGPELRELGILDDGGVLIRDASHFANDRFSKRRGALRCFDHAYSVLMMGKGTYRFSLLKLG